MIVTDLNYALENRLLKKLDLMIARCTQEHPKRDALLVNEGSESEGKSNSSIAEAYYAKCKTKRDIHLYFRLPDLIEFAKRTEGKIIIWDEPSLDSLKGDHFSKMNKDLTRLLMTARKKRHFFIFNLTKFYKFNEYVVVDRSLGMVHMYSRNEVNPGRFTYIKKRNLEGLYLGYTSKHKRMYKEFSSFRGQFPDIMEKHLDKMDIFINGKPHGTYKMYEEEKDKSIASIGVADTPVSKKEQNYINKIRELKQKFVEFARLKQTSMGELARFLKINKRNLYDWVEMGSNGQVSLGNPDFEGDEDANIMFNGVEPEEKSKKGIGIHTNVH